MFLLGTREVCRDTAAPFTCAIAVRADEIGRQTLTAVVTDSAGQTATSMRAVSVSKFRARLAHPQEHRLARPDHDQQAALAARRAERARRVLGRAGHHLQAPLAHRREQAHQAHLELQLHHPRVARARHYTVSAQVRGNNVLAAVKAANRKATVR